MKTLRVTVANVMVGEDEKKFNDMLTDMLLSAGFDLKQPIIKQPRSDVEAMDFIQFRYGVWDKIHVYLLHDYWRLKLWLARQFAKPEEEEKKDDENQEDKGHKSDNDQRESAVSDGGGLGDKH